MSVRKDCRNFPDCVKHTEMTLDWTAVSCDGCPAYAKRGLVSRILGWLGLI